jgi:hypothetical protein
MAPALVADNRSNRISYGDLLLHKRRADLRRNG